MSLIEFSVRGKYEVVQRQVLGSIIKDCYQKGRSIELTVPQCCALMKLTDICGWSFVIEDHCLIVESARKESPEYIAIPAADQQRQAHEVDLCFDRHRSKYRYDFSKYSVIVFDWGIVRRGVQPNSPSCSFISVGYRDVRLSCESLISYR